jgi:NitT/TauT family transport system permease protein
MKVKLFLPAMACLLSAILDFVIPDFSGGNTKVGIVLPLYRFGMALIGIAFLTLALINHRKAPPRSLTARPNKSPSTFPAKAPFYTSLILFFCAANMSTKMTTLLPDIYFPSFDRILSVYLTHWRTLLICAFYSLRLLVLGMASGGLIGFAMGLLLGWYQKAHYWIYPYIRFLGPIPATLWIPLAIFFFPSLLQASVFIIALSMWFPVTFLTASGAQNVNKAYYESASSLGASPWFQIWHVTIPAAMPQIFTGFFQGAISSLLALMSAELFGAKYGLGWYINWQQQVMDYPKVYAGFFIIALTCFGLFKLLFLFEIKVLSWKKEVIRW